MIKFRISGARVEFFFEMAEMTADDEADIACLIDAFQALAGDGVEVSCQANVVTEFGPPLFGPPKFDLFGVYSQNFRLSIADAAGPRPAVPGSIP
jgi:hypothetical protein